MRSEGNGAGRKVAGGGKRERDRNAARHLDGKSERQRKTDKHKGKICRGIRGNRQDPERDNNEPILLDCQHPSHHEGP